MTFYQTLSVLQSSPHCKELYAHAGDDGMDTDAFENVNLADAPAYAATKAALMRTATLNPDPNPGILNTMGNPVTDYNALARPLALRPTLRRI